MTAMVCSAVTHGLHWLPTRVLVDSGSKNLQLISQVLADRLGLQASWQGGARRLTVRRKAFAAV